MRKGLYLILILLFPSIIYMLFSLGEHRVEKIRSFGEYSINQEGDTVYQPVPSVSFLDETGKRVNMEDLRGKPIAINVISYPCDSLCKKKGNTLANYLNELGEREKWEVLSIIPDTSVSMAALEELRQKHLPEMSNWHFVKPTNSDSYQEFFEYSYVQNEKDNQKDNTSSSNVVLIDQTGVIRAYFDLDIYKDNRKMEDAIKLLLQEPYLTWKSEKES